MSGLTHFDDAGASRMVNVGGKPVTHRTATASAVVTMQAETLTTIRDRKISKGDVLEVARLAGIMAAKRTDELIPLCHVLPLDAVRLTYEFPSEQSVRLLATVETHAKTGVEMEALTAVTIAALTVYDMCKAMDRGMVIGPVQLEQKDGGASGRFQRQASGTN